MSLAFFVPEAGIEPARPKWAQDFKSGASTYSATQALNPFTKNPDLLSGLWAENETRTRDPDLGKVVLYQLSSFRVVWWCKDTHFLITRKYFFNFFYFFWKYFFTHWKSDIYTDKKNYKNWFTLIKTSFLPINTTISIKKNITISRKK